MTNGPDFTAERLLKEHEVRSLWTEHRTAQILGNLGWSASQSVTYRDASTGKYRELDILARRAYRNEQDGRSFRIDLLVALKSLHTHHVVVLPAPTDLVLDEVRCRPGPIFDSGSWTTTEFSVSEADVEALRHEVSRGLLPRLALHACPRKVTIARPFREVRPKCAARELGESVLFQTHRALDAAAAAIKDDRIEQARTLVQDISARGLDASARYRTIVGLCAHIGRIGFGFHRVVLLEGGLHELRAESRLEVLPGFRLAEMSVGTPRGWTDVAALEHVESYFESLTGDYDAELASKGYVPCRVDDVRIARPSDAELVGCPLTRFD